MIKRSTAIKYFLFFSLLLLFLNIYNVNDGLTQLSDYSEMRDQADAFRGEAGYEEEQDVAAIVATIIKAFLGLLGIIFIILMIAAGYNWMTAAGDEEKINKAKDTIKRAIIGLLIIVTAYAITVFVFQNLPGGNGGGGSVTTD